MINNRPKHLEADPTYSTLPPLPIAVDFSPIPDLIRETLAGLRGLQSAFLDGYQATEDENGSCQMISLIASIVGKGYHDEKFLGVPFALTLLPASKRGNVSHTSPQFCEQLDLERYLQTSPSYMDFDPFSGTRGLYGSLGLFLSEKPQKGYLDEVGLVVDQYFLQIGGKDDSGRDELEDITNERLRQKYSRYRDKLLLSPFKKVETRRIWGAESPIELFLIQELARRGLFPQLQMLIFDDGKAFPSWYHLWRDLEFRHSPGLVTEADLFFPELQGAVFCDSSRYHSRPKQREKDERISARLRELGFTPVRVPGKQIVEDVKSAGDLVCKALGM